MLKKLVVVIRHNGKVVKRPVQVQVQEKAIECIDCIDEYVLIEVPQTTRVERPLQEFRVPKEEKDAWKMSDTARAWAKKLGLLRKRASSRRK